MIVKVIKSVFHNIFGSGDKYDKSVQDFVEKSSAKWFMVEKLTMGFQTYIIEPVEEKIEPPAKKVIVKKEKEDAREKVAGEKVVRGGGGKGKIRRLPKRFGGK